MDEATRRVLMEQGLYGERMIPETDTKNAPYTTAGIPGLVVNRVPYLDRTNTGGFVVNGDSSDNGPGLSPDMFVKTTAGPETIAHEAEHLMARRQLGTGHALNTKFDELIGDPAKRLEFVNAALDAAPYLKEKYGLSNAYFDPQQRKLQGPLTKNLLYEQLASLAGAEVAQGVDLTKDPVLRKTLFKDKDVRETYNAITGLRQTRLDAKDLPPYTRQPETGADVGAVSKIKKLIGLANGGAVPEAKNTKLI